MYNQKSIEELEKIRQKKLQELRRRTMPEKQTNPDWPSEPLHTTDISIQQTVQKYPLVVIDCWAPWCGPCRMLAPTIEELAKEYAGKIVFGKLNTDENQATAREYGIMSIPTLLVFKNGKLVDTLIGALPKKMLEQAITRHL